VSDTNPTLIRLNLLDTTLLSDALDAYGLPGGTGALVAQGGTAQLCGRVRTVQLAPVNSGEAPGPHIATQAIAAARPGDVIVVANQGRTGVSCWGGLLSLGSLQRGVRGVVADGVCRDVAEARALGFAVFSRGVTPRTARTRLKQVAYGGPISVDGIPVSDGDYVLADDSGVVFVPADRIEAVLTRAEWARDREAAIAADIRSGISIDEAMHDSRLTSATDHTN
jgi:regulator of RNase E activity RraA